MIYILYQSAITEQDLTPQMYILHVDNLQIRTAVNIKINFNIVLQSFTNITIKKSKKFLLFIHSIVVA